MEITALTNSENTSDFSGQLALPFNQQQLGSFIVSLLGKPQTITKQFRGSYEIDVDILSSLFQIIEQRIKQQNEATLVQFRTVVSYNDGATVELNGFEHLVNYNESMHLIPVAVDLTWQYLIKFRDKEVPEKQEITISFVSDGHTKSYHDNHFEYRGSEHQISLRINHTARTWGADIEALLSRHLSGLIKKTSWLKKVYTYDDDSIHRVVNVFFLTTTLIISATMINKVNTTYIIYLLGGTVILSQLFRLILDKITPQMYNSFILLTKSAYENRDKTMTRSNMQWIEYFATLIVGLLLNVVGSYVYAYLIK